MILKNGFAKPHKWQLKEIESFSGEFLRISELKVSTIVGFGVFFCKNDSFIHIGAVSFYYVCMF